MVNIGKNTDTFGKKKYFVWKIIRPIIPHKVRFYLEGNPNIKGQLRYAERKALYNTIRKYKPVNCFEIGTWKGGGTTYFIAQALHDNGKGILNTIEINKDFYYEAKNNYKQNAKHLIKYVHFNLGDYRIKYNYLLKKLDKIDLLFLDGAEDKQQTLEQYNFFLPYFKKGTILICHDWFTEKMNFIKPLVEDYKKWEIKKILVPPISIGLVIAVKK